MIVAVCVDLQTCCYSIYISLGEILVCLGEILVCLSHFVNIYEIEKEISKILCKFKVMMSIYRLHTALCLQVSTIILLQVSPWSLFCYIFLLCYQNDLYSVRISATVCPEMSYHMLKYLKKNINKK